MGKEGWIRSREQEGTLRAGGDLGDRRGHGCIGIGGYLYPQDRRWQWRQEGRWGAGGDVE